MYGKAVVQEESLEAVRALQHHLVHVLGAELLDRWTVEVSARLTRYIFQFVAFHTRKNLLRCTVVLVSDVVKLLELL